MRVLLSVVTLLAVAIISFGLGTQWPFSGSGPVNGETTGAPEQESTDLASKSANDPLSVEDTGRIVDELAQVPGIDGPAGKPASDANYRGDDSCQWANDGECDDPGLGTGACSQGTDYSDCWRIATGVEDDSCQHANDGECDEPRLGTGACTQATDTTDCGDVAYLRFQNDSCTTAFDGVCNEPGQGDGSCEAGTDRADCLGRERPMQISDHFFGRDDRLFMDTSVLPWSVVGTLTDANGGQCTATLVGENILVTAAHCIEYDTGVDATGTFETAFDRRGGSLSAEVIDFWVSPDRAADNANNDEAAGTDWALLRLDQPIGRELGFVGVRGLVDQQGERGAVGHALYQAGYSHDTGDHLSGNIACEVVDIEDQNRIVHNCDTTTGDSGSPIMSREGDLYFVIATDSTFRFAPNVPASNIATRSEDWLGLIADFTAGTLTNGGVRPAGGGDDKPVKAQQGSD